MSYARLGPDSDVYIYATSPRWTHVCQWCRLVHGGGTGPASDHRSRTRFGMAFHVCRHLLAGHKIPEGTVRALIVGGG